ncbi:hypothetical protein IHE33_12495 (plasmid) [Mycetohabitans endofungorum]|uniref:hypothetical protein n=1 Tax=Mycetohabitans endofungorum TaxID=417203 RepID=UPI0030CE4D14
MYKAIAQLQDVVGLSGLMLTTAAVAWVLANLVATCASIVASRSEQLADTLTAVDVMLDVDLKARLNKLMLQYRRADAPMRRYADTPIRRRADAVRWGGAPEWRWCCPTLRFCRPGARDCQSFRHEGAVRCVLENCREGALDAECVFVDLLLAFAHLEKVIWRACGAQGATGC